MPTKGIIEGAKMPPKGKRGAAGGASGSGSKKPRRADDEDADLDPALQELLRRGEEEDESDEDWEWDEGDAGKAWRMLLATS